MYPFKSVGEKKKKKKRKYPGYKTIGPEHINKHSSETIHLLRLYDGVKTV